MTEMTLKEKLLNPQRIEGGSLDTKFNESVMKDAAARLDELEATKLRKRPVAFRVKDFADGWIIFQSENDANTYAGSVGAMVQGLYVRDGT